MINSSKGRWFVKVGDSIQGPFPNKLIGRYLILGRLTQEVLVSQDKKNWAPVKNYPAMVPEVVKEAGTPQGDKALMLARIREDERSSRSDSIDDYEDRRDEEEEIMQLHRQIRDDVLQQYSFKPKSSVIYAALVVLLIVVVGGIYLATSTNKSSRLADCKASAKPGINWSGCNKQGEVLRSRDLSNVNLRNAKLESIDFSNSVLQYADLAYADMSRSILISSQLQSALLKGTNLRNANLQQANLTNADLSYAELVGAQLDGANLSNAIFDNAIWVNGETCIPGSIGACLLPVDQ